MVEGLPASTYKKTKDIPTDLVTQAYYNSNNVTQASKLLASTTGFTDRGIRYFLRKLENSGFLEPSRLMLPSKKHIDAVNKSRAEHGVAPVVFPPTLQVPVKKKKIEEDRVMVTVHLRAESNGMGMKGMHPIYLEASFSRILPVNYGMDDLHDMMGYLKDRIVNTGNYGSLAGIIEMDDSYVQGVEVEKISQSHHTDGEIIIPEHPRRHR